MIAIITLTYINSCLKAQFVKKNTEISDRLLEHLIKPSNPDAVESMLCRQVFCESSCYSYYRFHLQGIDRIVCAAGGDSLMKILLSKEVY